MRSAATVLRDRLNDSARIKAELAADDESMATLAAVAELMVRCLQGGGTVFFCGNGGSSTDADHLSAELLGRFYRDRAALRSVSLSTNTAAMTAIGNDYGYDETFVRQLSGLSRPGDVLIALSTSGNSANVVRAVEWAQGQGVATVALTGRAGGKLAGLADHVLQVPTDDTPRIQECHLNVGHTLCELIEDRLFPAPGPTP